MLVTRSRRFKIFHRYVRMPSCPVTNRNHGNREPPLRRQTWTIRSGSSSSSCFAQSPKLGVRFFSLTTDDHRIAKPANTSNNLKLNKKRITLSPDSKTKLPVNSTNLFEHTKEICDETIYPIRAFSRNEGYCRYFHVVFCEVAAKAERLLHDKYNFNNSVGSHEMQISNTINLAFQLLIRINREPWKLNYTRSKWEPLYLFKHKPIYTIMLLRLWNMSVLQNEPNLRTAQEVTQLVEQIISSTKDVDSHSHKEQTRFDMVTTISMILPVAIHEARDTTGPLQSTDVLSNIYSAQAPQATSDASPKKLVLNLYNALLKADAERKSSDFNEALKRMFDLIEEMRVKHSVQPDVTTYNTLLRFLRLSNGSSLERFESAFKLMQLDNIAPNMSTYNEVVQCYSSSNNEEVNHEKLALAEQYLKQMIELIFKVEPVRTDDNSSKNTDVRQQYMSDVTSISNCAHSVMDAYVRDLMAQSSKDRQQEIVNQAKKLFLLLDQTNIVPNESIRQLSRKVFAMYARCGNLAGAKIFMMEISNPSIRFYRDMIATFGDTDLIDDTIEVFRMMLDDPRVSPNINAFNDLLDACAKSNSQKHTAFGRATELVDILGKNERCVQLQLRPNVDTYNSLFKCLLKSAPFQEGVSAIAESIFLEMEERRKTDSAIEPTLFTFELAISIGSLVDDQNLIDAVVSKMEPYNFPCDKQLCHRLLNHYAKTATPETAERAELFLSSQKKKSYRPDSYTYNILLNVWGRSNHPDFPQRMLSIYKSMLSSEGTKPDAVTFSTLAAHLTKSPNNLDMVDKLLQESEGNQHYPGHDSYSLLIKAYVRSCDAENATRVLFRWFGAARDPRNGISNLVLESMTPLYHQLAQLWIHLGDLERATTVTDEIYKFHMDANKDKNISGNNSSKQTALSPKPGLPSVQTYILLHQAWEKSHHQLKVEYLNQIKAKISPII